MAVRTRIASCEYHIPRELAFHIHVVLLDHAELEVRGLVKQRSGETRKTGRRVKNRKSAGYTGAGRGSTIQGAVRGRESAPGGSKNIALREEGWILPEALSTLAPGGVVEDGVAGSDYGLVAASDFPSQAKSRLKGRPIHLYAGRRTHSILIGDKKLIRKRIVVCHTPMLFRDRSRQIPCQAEIEGQRFGGSPVILDERTVNLPASTGHWTVKGLIVLA